jgi:Domain of unknown function (DUF4340)
MLRMRGLVIALAVLVALAGGVYWSNKAKEAEAKKPAADTTTKILDLQGKPVTKVEIRRTGGETTVLEKKGQWVLTAPRPLSADQEAVGSLLVTLTGLNADRVIEAKTDDPGAFGLAQPLIDVTFTQKDGKSRQLLIGDEVPTGNGYYVKLADDPRIFSIASYAKTSLDKTENDLRDKRLLTFDIGKLTRVEIAAKGPAFELGKNNQNEWQILKPRPMRADGGLVGELIGRLQDAKMDTSVSDEDMKKAAAAFASAAPLATIKVTDAAGTQQLQIRKDKEHEYYARSSVVEGVYKLAPGVASAFDKSVDDLRSKKLFDFGWTEPTRIDVRDGAKSASYERSGEKWMSGGKQMDAASVGAVTDKLRGLSASKFVDKGFSTPSIDLTVTSADGKRVEKVSLSKTGNDWFAMRENEPTIYQLDANVVDGLQNAIAAVKEAAPAKVAKK